MEAEFKITTEPVGCFLNVQIDRNNDGSIVISQRRYTEDILRRYYMENAYPMTGGSCEFCDNKSSMSKGRGMMYLAVVTLPDITFAVGYVSQFLEKPEERHWAMVKRIFKYLKGTTAYGIRYSTVMANELNS